MGGWVVVTGMVVGIGVATVTAVARRGIMSKRQVKNKSTGKTQGSKM